MFLTVRRVRSALAPTYQSCCISMVFTQSRMQNNVTALLRISVARNAGTSDVKPPLHSSYFRISLE